MGRFIGTVLLAYSIEIMDPWIPPPALHHITFSFTQNATIEIIFTSLSSWLVDKLTIGTKEANNDYIPIEPILTQLFMSKSRLTISSNTLFHFTSNIENVIGILEHGFRPHYCLENLNFIFGGDADKHEELICAFPMVCFCDIPLSHAKTHMKRYGEYGIGLSKKWGIERNISPVLYAHKQSKIIKIVTEMLSKMDDDFEQNNKDNSRDYYFTAYREIFSMIKPYKGKLWRNGDYTKTLRFYDEREWRFVPMKDPFKSGLLKIYYDDEKIRERLQRELWKQEVLRFKPSDIKYIIVSSEDEIIPIITKIEQKSKYDANQIKLLCSRVISAEQILEDF